MPKYTVTDPQSGRKVTLTGDSPPTEQELEEIFANLPAPAKVEPQQSKTVPGDYPEIPQVDQSGVPVARQQGSAQVATPSFSDRLVGAGETALSAATGATTGLAGSMAGALKGIGGSMLSGTYGTQAGAEAAQRESQELGARFTYEPRTKTGQDYVQNIGEAAAPLAGLSPFAQEAAIIGRSAGMAAQQPRAAISGITGEGKSLVNGERIQAGSTDRDLAKFQVASNPNAPASQAPKATKDAQASEAIRQGFDDGVVQALKASSDVDKAKMLRMANIAEKAKKDAVFAATNRPADVAGDSLVQRINKIKATNRQAAIEVDRAAENIKGKPVDYEPALQQFKDDIAGAGVTIDENGNLNFKGSDLEFSAGDKKLISDVYSRARRLDGSDAYPVHKIKRLIDSTVDYGKSSQKGVTPKGEQIVKSFRRAVDGQLDSTFEDYNTANTKYADTIGALNDFQDAAGGKVNLFGDNADKALGAVSRRLLSNAQSRVSLMDSIKKMDDVSLKYGQRFDDDLITQMMFADELEKIFGATARTSLQGDVEKAVKRGINTSMTEKAVDLAARQAEKLRGINEENAFKSIKSLLERDSKK